MGGMFCGAEGHALLSQQDSDGGGEAEGKEGPLHRYPFGGIHASLTDVRGLSFGFLLPCSVGSHAWVRLLFSVRHRTHHWKVHGSVTKVRIWHAWQLSALFMDVFL